jgi:hypothetical protein
MMQPMTLFDLKSLEIRNMTERANRLGWLIESASASKPAGDRRRSHPETLLVQVGIALVLLLALLVLNSAMPA